VQGLLAKLGLTRSYVLVNAYGYALLPSRADDARPLLSQPAHRTWRNDLWDAITGPPLEAVIAFGAQAQAALALWDPPAGVPTFSVPHPSSRDPDTLLTRWKAAVAQLRTIVTPDPDGSATGPNYGTTFRESDYARIPHRDLPFGVPAWLGDDRWGRTASPRHNNSVSRPSSDLRHTLVWTAPADQP
jgi:hypothetical protein